MSHNARRLRPENPPAIAPEIEIPDAPSYSEDPGGDDDYPVEALTFEECLARRERRRQTLEARHLRVSLLDAARFR